MPMKTLLNKIPGVLAIKELLVRAYYTVLFWEPVWWHVVNRRRRMLFQAAGVTLDAVQQRVVGDLEKNGIAFVHIDELFPGRNLLPKLQEYARELRAAAKTHDRKKFLLELFEASPVFDFSQPFVQFALNERILAVVSSYLKLAPRFYAYTLNVTLPVSEDAARVQSQRWHRDPEDKKLCKVFLYLNDVDQGRGPFTYVLGSQYGGKWRGPFPQRPPHGSYPPEGAVEKMIPAGDIREATAPAGTIIFCDTSGIHRGGYARAGERIMFTGGFITDASSWYPSYRFPDGSHAGRRGESPLVRAALMGKFRNSASPRY